MAFLQRNNDIISACLLLNARRFGVMLPPKNLKNSALFVNPLVPKVAYIRSPHIILMGLISYIYYLVFTDPSLPPSSTISTKRMRFRN